MEHLDGNMLVVIPHWIVWTILGLLAVECAIKVGGLYVDYLKAKIAYLKEVARAAEYQAHLERQNAILDR